VAATHLKDISPPSTCEAEVSEIKKNPNNNPKIRLRKQAAMFERMKSGL